MAADDHTQPRGFTDEEVMQAPPANDLVRSPTDPLAEFVAFIASHKMRFFTITVSKNFDSGDWIVCEATDGVLGPPLFVGAKEAADFERIRLNREAAEEYNGYANKIIKGITGATN